MKFNRWSLLILFQALAFSSFAQKLKKPDKIIFTNLQKHIAYLADDKLEGRRTGTAGETLAMNYIAGQFREIGLQAKGSDNYYQSFDVYDGKQINPSTQLFINKNELKQGKDFFPLAYSPNASIEALPAISLEESDMPWFIDLKDALVENANNPHFDLEEFIKNKSVEIKKKGATAMILFNSSSKEDGLKFDPKDRTETLKIPVVFLSRNVYDKYLSDPAATINIKMKVDIGEKKRIGHNVIGFINNGSVNTVVLGAHFDHLGYGEDGNSMLRTGERLIHNGADDNASGVAALIELARLLKNSKAKNNNYLFIAFSGEELGLFGSKYFVENSTIDLAKVSYMINMDMVGRLNDSTKVLTIGGYGTSPAWSSLIKPDQKNSGFILKTDSSGTGPSDHTSFYRKDIPVLFFFTGLHADYHRPTDDYDKINYTGELNIVKYIYSLIEKENKEKQKLAFTKTRETQTSTSARFSVTMGIMPDYTYAGTGVRVDGVSDGRPAQKAGLLTGDVIMQLGDFQTSSLQNYMQALGKFKKGDSTVVKIKRGNNLLEKTVKF
jgi:aminopeptidase YwaD